MNPIRNPFSRDEYPALTDAINGVVNGQPRPVEDPITEDAMTAERDAELRGKMKREKDYGEYRKLRAQREKEAKSKKLYGKGGKIDTSRKPDVSKSKQIWEDIQTPAREREMKGKIKRAENTTDTKANKYMRAIHKAAMSLAPSTKKAQIKAGKRYEKAAGAENKLNTLQRKEEMSRRLYGKGGKLVKKSVKESQELDERIIDEVDFFQASKNWVKGKGFKTNREVSYDRVEKNYQAMKKRQEAEAKKNK